MQKSERRGPLASVRVVEFAGLGPAPFAAMILADYGAQVIRIDRHAPPVLAAGSADLDFLNRSRPSVAIDLKSPDGLALAKDLIAHADVLIEGFRPGVMERFGLGPDDVSALNPGLIYGRMTGWGQQGPLAHKAGHDINYLALTGALHMIGPADAPPVVPINFVADFGGGAMFLISGILAALVERQASGRGQVIDAAMVDGASVLMTQIYGWKAVDFWQKDRAANLLDGGAYFYRCYATADRRYMAVGAIEPQFHDALVEGLGLDRAAYRDHMNRAHWPVRTEAFAAVFRTRTRDEWVAHLDAFDACASPVLTPDEAVTYPVNAARDTHRREGPPQPHPAPRFSRTPASIGIAPGSPGDGGQVALAAWGVADGRVAKLRTSGTLKAN